LASEKAVRLSASLPVLFFVFCLPALAQDTTGVGSIFGTIRDTAGKELAGAQVCIADSTRCGVSGDRGEYRISDIRAGEYRLAVTLSGKPLATTNSIEVRAGLQGTVDIVVPSLDAVQQSITVREDVFVAPEEIKNSSYLASGTEVWKLAGALQDVSRYVQTLPGVVIGSDDFRNDIIVRGGSPLENLFIIDNIEIPNINNFANFASAGGTNSILDAALIQDITFLTGGYPSPFINRTSSVLQVTQREGRRDRFGGRATLGFGGAGGILEGPINKGRGSWIASARRSFLDLFTDDVGFGGVPVVYTFNTKATYDVTARDRIWVANISGIDRIRLGLRDGNTFEEELDTLDIRYNGWRSATGVNWQRLFGSRGVGLLGFTHSEARVDQQVKDLVRNGSPDLSKPVDTIIDGAPVIFKDDSREGETTLKYDLTIYAPLLNKVQTGGSFKIFQLDYNVQSPFGSDNPFSPVRDVNPFDLRRNFRAYQNSGYIQTSQNLGPRLNLTWGGRVDNYQYIGRTRFSPRAALNVRLTDRLIYKLSYGRYHQQPFFLFLAAFPQNRDLLPWRADHFVTGMAYQASPTLRFSVEAYRKNYADYPVSTQFPSLSLANVGDTFAVQDVLFPLTSAGRGYAQGVELLVEKKFGEKWFGQGNISLSRARQAAIDGVARATTFDYPVAANFTGGYRLSRKWELGARGVFLSGRPYTPFLAETSAAQRRGVFDLTRVAAERLPNYFRLDLRLDRTFTVRDKPLLFFIGAQNITNRKNPAGLNWNRAINAAEFGEQQGIFPLVGLEWRF